MMLACELKKQCCSGPGYASPKDAFSNGYRERFLFVTCANTNSLKPDMIASVDVDPTSPTFCKVNIPCYGDKNAKRSHLVVPCLLSSRIYFIDTLDPGNLKLFDAVGTWIAKNSKKPEFNYDFWYQPRQNVMISSEWGAPAAIKQGFNMKHVQEGLYGNKIHVWDWKEHVLKQSIELDACYGAVPLEVRFFHEPTSTHCFVGTALGSTVYHVY
uniref:Selenium-binding protein n=1 Tax=Parascaris equorum TaxID=6256 RepID=A0A914R8E4_PAREQ